MSFKIKMISTCATIRELLEMWTEKLGRNESIVEEASDQRTVNVFVEKS